MDGPEKSRKYLQLGANKYVVANVQKMNKKFAENTRKALDLPINTNVIDCARHFTQTWLFGGYSSMLAEALPKSNQEHELLLKDYLKFLYFRSLDPTIKPSALIWVVWHSHILRTVCYDEICKKLCGKLVDHDVFVDMPTSAAVSSTVDIANFNWGESVSTSLVDEVHQSLLEVLTLEIFSRDASFFEIVIANGEGTVLHFDSFIEILTDANFMNLLYDLYKCHIFASTLYGAKNSIAPSQLIDWLWHAHQLQAAAYRGDCHNAVGFTITHTTFANAMPESFRQELGERTRNRWQELFGVLPMKLMAEERHRSLAAEGRLESLLQIEAEGLQNFHCFSGSAYWRKTPGTTDT